MNEQGLDSHQSTGRPDALATARPGAESSQHSDPVQQALRTNIDCRPTHPKPIGVSWYAVVLSLEFRV